MVVSGNTRILLEFAPHGLLDLRRIFEMSGFNTRAAAALRCNSVKPNVSRNFRIRWCVGRHKIQLLKTIETTFNQVRKLLAVFLGYLKIPQRYNDTLPRLTLAVPVGLDQLQRFS